MDDLVVVSDLHLGRGFNPATRRFHALETFFYDEEFLGFCRFLVSRGRERGRRVRLIFNGDTFDFLRIVPPKNGGKESAREQRFGPALTPARAARMIAEILDGHPKFVQAIAALLVEGHSVVFLPGNHDLEVHWEPVQQVARDKIAAALGENHDAIARLEFRPWFYFEPGRVWIEHGCQYDPENAFRYPLRGRLAADPGFSPEGEADMPLGSFFQRYLYNAFGSITFIVPSSRANGRYAKWLLLNQPRLLLRVARSHFPFALQVLRRLAEGRGALEKEYAAAHASHLASLAAESGLGSKLERIDALKKDGADALLATQVMARQIGKLALVAGFTVMTVLVVWMTLSHAIGELTLGLGWKTLLSLALNMCLLFAVIAIVTYRMLRVPAPTYQRPLRRAAEEICQIAGVPLTVFGHTHEEVVFSLGKTSEHWYLNSGTWIAVFTHDVLLPRQTVQFSFVDIEGKNAQLMHWSPGRDAALPVILLDEAARDPMPIAP